MFKARGWGKLFPKYPKQGFGNGHFGANLFVGHENTFTGIVPLGHHIHFQLGRPHRITLADHIAKRTVAAVWRITGYQQIAQVYRRCIVGRFAMRYRVFAIMYAHLYVLYTYLFQVPMWRRPKR